MTAASPAEPTRGASHTRHGRVALVLFLCLFAIYQLNWTVLDEGDAVPTANLPVALLETRGFSFDPDHFPEMFKWRSHPPFMEKDDFFFTSWKDRFGDRTAGEWRDSGHLEFNGPRYYLVESRRRHTYVSTFGPIPGLILFPVMAPFHVFDHDVASNLGLRASIAKLGASAVVAFTAVLLFLIALRRTTRRRSLLLAITYGLGTCAWAVSSQNMWQQTVNQLFLALGAFFLLGNIDRRRAAALAGLAFGAAAACRATGAVVLIAVLVELLRSHRKSLAPYVLGAAPVPLLVFAYNQYYFGSPLIFAQELIGHAIAQQKTGSPDLWQTPLWEGALGLLASPSRGLLIFSPVLAPAFWGIVRIWRDRSFVPYRPLTIGAVATMAAQCKWFDWWGGHAYGYRPWLDAVPYLVLFLLPVIEPLTRTPVRRAILGAALAWSVFVQGLGAMTYDRSWNLRLIFVARLARLPDPVSFLDEGEARGYAEAHDGTFIGPSLCDIDLPFCRHRLWSFADSMILYQFTHYAETRARRLPTGWSDLRRSR